MSVFRKRWRVIFTSMTAGIAIATTVAILLPTEYEATARILTTKQSPSLSDSVAAVAAGEISGQSPNDLYLALMHSRTIAERLIERFSLTRAYDQQTLDGARKTLDSATVITSGREGVISISVRDRDAERAASLANGYVEELQHLTDVIALTESSQRRLFFENESKKARENLTKAEIAFNEVQGVGVAEKLDRRTRATIDAAMAVRAEIAAKVVQIEVIGSSETTPSGDLTRAREELIALQAKSTELDRRQQSTGVGTTSPRTLPKDALEYVARLRELKYHEAFFDLLLRQFQIARLTQAKDAALIQIVDRAVMPKEEVRTVRARLQVALLLTLLAVLYGCLAALVAERRLGLLKGGGGGLSRMARRWSVRRVPLAEKDGPQS